jgi:lipoprotein-releasing system permease protein
MRLESSIAKRYLWTARKQRHTAFLSLISILGLAVGVAALLISIGLLSGLQGQIKKQLIAASPQVLVEPKGKHTIDDAPAIVALGRKLGMTDIQPFISGIGYGGNESAERGRPVHLRSYAPGAAPKPERPPRVPLAPDEPRVYVTPGFAASLSLEQGQVLTIVAPRTRLTPFGPAPVWKKYRIAGLVIPKESQTTIDAWVEDAEAAHLFGTDGKPTTIEMYGPPDLSESAQAGLAAKFPGVQFKTWKEINRPLVLALRLEKVVMFASISLIIFVAALNLISSLSMLIMEKRPSVGVLRTLGASEGSIRSVFMQLGLLIGLTGTLLGNILGIGLSWLADHYQLIPLPSDMYFVGYLPFSLDAQDIVVVNLIAVALSIVATWYPARIAARLDPIAAIKEE